MQDDAPTTPATRFVPYFWIDTLGNAGASNTTNSYLTDTPWHARGDCDGQPVTMTDGNNANREPGRAEPRQHVQPVQISRRHRRERLLRRHRAGNARPEPRLPEADRAADNQREHVDLGHPRHGAPVRRRHQPGRRLGLGLARAVAGRAVHAKAPLMARTCAKSWC